MGDASFNAIAILDAIPDGELNTARRLREDLLDLCLGPAAGLSVRYAKIIDIEALKAELTALTETATNTGLKPWLHLEGHGTDDELGFVTASGQYCSWSDLVDLVTPLNVASNLNVVLILATCYGGSLVRAMTTIDHAPVLGLIGPARMLSAGEVEVDFPAFYRTFFETGSLKSAIAALEARAGKRVYYRTTAEDFFYAVWSMYKKDQCTDEKIRIRSRNMRKKLRESGAPGLPSIGELKRKFRSEERSRFDEYRDKYFLYDLYPNNQARFPVTYKAAEKEAAR